ncbi:MAG: ABC transporter ATP-binding protein/permease [Clostridiales bacterium]|jgi:putative ABC transport system permease protein|nr:ABC transporter ATP-binding protein/permease [Clostridiales bacterium]
MLELKNITKTYVAGDTKTAALDGVTLSFGSNEFVAILGASGSGKTTMLNVIGGLDQYESGDLVINGTSTKEYKDRDWDAYRNHSVGFVFQSYNLIPHQSVLSNVELALTLSGVSKGERRRRAKEALAQVGLADQIHKKPSQMSGGQMQRVAIARALVNNPEIILADEPTGALDTETSVQIMELLQNVARDRLVIMVTHNPELADAYATRIVRLQDGKILSDKPNRVSEEARSKEPTAPVPGAGRTGKRKKTSMSFFTALSLSLNNLMTKKGRTVLTSFAGSIGIIGIALILSLSNGIQLYINRVQEDTLSGYPVTIQAESIDLGKMLSAFMDSNEATYNDNKVHASSQMQDMFNSLSSIDTSNNLTDFKTYLDNSEELKEYITAIQYGYGLDLLIYGYDNKGEFITVNPSTVMRAMHSAMGFSYDDETMASSPYSQYTMQEMNVWSEIMPGKDGETINALVKEQYELLEGSWPDNYDEVVLVISKNNELSDVYLYSLGLRDQNEIEDIMSAAMRGEETEVIDESWDYDQLMDLSFYAVLPSDYYTDNDKDGVWTDMRDNEDYMKITAENGIELKVSGIIRPNEDAVSTSIQGAVGYTSELTRYIINETNKSEIVTQQKENPSTDVFTGLPFDDGSMKELDANEKAQAFAAYAASLSVEEKANLFKKIAAEIPADTLEQTVNQYMAAYPDRASMETAIIENYKEASGADEETVRGYISKMTDEELTTLMRESIAEMAAAKYAQETEATLASLSAEQLAVQLDAMLSQTDPQQAATMYDSYMPPSVSEATYDENIAKLSAVDLDTPSAINIYASSFEAKDKIAEIIEAYNAGVEEQDQITYTDYVAILMSSITTIINAISYVLIAFVSISLVVSSIMIGIITYISVLERTKEIGILRSIGASKQDVSRVFNAETLIVGLAAGMIGIGITILLCIPASLIIEHFTEIPNIASLPWQAGVILVAISMILTLISGLIPSRLAAKKDPVEALRSE